jgi:hypothetical protein
VLNEAIHDTPPQSKRQVCFVISTFGATERGWLAELWLAGTKSANMGTDSLRSSDAQFMHINCEGSDTWSSLKGRSAHEEL